MRLLNTTTLELKSFFAHKTPDYVILSLRWGQEEVVCKDMIICPMSDMNSPARRRMGFSKVDGTCKLAAADGYDWVWIDNCCIDKESSADVDTSINSMWTYYSKPNICYVYMADILDSEAGWGEGFRQSRWFFRGWTLQELTAPVYVEFYSLLELFQIQHAHALWRRSNQAPRIQADIQCTGHMFRCMRDDKGSTF